MPLAKIRRIPRNRPRVEVKPVLKEKAAPVHRHPKTRGLHIQSSEVLAAMARIELPRAQPEVAVPETPTKAPPPEASASTPKGRRKSKSQKESSAGAEPKPRRKTARPPVDLNLPGFLRLVDVLTVIPVSYAKWYAGVKDGTYPRSYQLGPRAVGWQTSDIKALVERLLAAPPPSDAASSAPPTE